jgi:hypothetical protein
VVEDCLNLEKPSPDWPTPVEKFRRDGVRLRPKGGIRTGICL